MGRLVVPDEYARAALRRRLHVLNTRGQARPPLPAELRLRLTEEFGPEVRRLETLLDRDLKSWLAPGVAGGRGSPATGVASDRRAR
jgi:hypothetical protein